MSQEPFPAQLRWGARAELSVRGLLPLLRPRRSRDGFHEARTARPPCPGEYNGRSKTLIFCAAPLIFSGIFSYLCRRFEKIGEIFGRAVAAVVCVLLRIDQPLYPRP